MERKTRFSELGSKSQSQGKFNYIDDLMKKRKAVIDLPQNFGKKF